MKRIVAAVALLSSQLVLAADFCVNSEADNSNIDPLNTAHCTASCTVVVGAVCNYREALTKANATAGADRIIFGLPGVVPGTISFNGGQGSLPTINETLTIDGYTQPGSARATSNAAAVLPVKILCPAEVCLKVPPLTNNPNAGTVIEGIDFEGLLSAFAPIIDIEAPGARIEGNVFHRRSPETVNQMAIMIASTSNAVVGGATVGQRNVFYRNYSGVEVYASTNVSIYGNWFGLLPDGNVEPIPDPPYETGGKTRFGVITDSPVAIGGATAGQGNVFAAMYESNVVGSGTAITAGTGAIIDGNLIGTNALGASSASFLPAQGVAINATGASTIGEAAAGARNVICAQKNGISLSGAGQATIVNNRIGIDATGAECAMQKGIAATAPALIGTAGAGNAIANFTFRGVDIQNGVTVTLNSNTIGPAAAASGVFVLGATAVIGGNGLGNTIVGCNYGVEVSSGVATLAGNYIGVTSAGVASANQHGVRMTGGNVTVGVVNGVTGERNVISGNAQHGISVIISGGSGSDRLRVANNLIGLAPDGTTARGNGSAGVSINGSGPLSYVVGGQSYTDANLISSNGTYGLELGLSPSNLTASDVHVQFNLIGTNAAGTAARPNVEAGIFAANGTTNLRIGGPSAPNLISGNGTVGSVYGDGILAMSSNALRVQSNVIGLASDGSTPLGNKGSGIRLLDSNDARIGGVASNQINVIAFNGGKGIMTARSGPGAFPTNGAFNGNLIRNNTGLDIDLDGDGVTANDGLLGGGANRLRDRPVLGGARTLNGTTTLIEGTFTLNPAATHYIEYYSAASCHPLGAGGGAFLGSQLVTPTGVPATAALSFTVPTALPVGSVVTATASLVSGVDPVETSELSACRTVASTGEVGFASASMTVSETAGTASIVINRDGGVAGAVDVTITSTPGTATSPGDFTALSQTVSFANGESTKTVSLALNNDTTPENDESLTLTLSAPTNGLLLGAASTMTVTIQSDEVPMCNDGIVNTSAEECDGSGTPCPLVGSTCSNMCLCVPPVIDAGMPPVDAGSPPDDAGAPMADAGAPTGDAGSTPADDAGSMPIADAGEMSADDAGTTPGNDAGTSAMSDSGVMMADAGGSSTTDAGRPMGSDAGTGGGGVDAGADPGDVAGGCGCGSTDGSLLGVMAMIWLGLSRRRRQ